VGENGFRQRFFGGHQERGPIDAVEANDFLAYQMKLRGPILFPLEFVVAIADAAQIAGERIVPDVDDVFGIAGPGQAPFHGFAADGDVAQARFHPAQDFVAAEGRANEIGLFLVQFHEAVLERGELEEIVFLIDQFTGTAAQRAIGWFRGVGYIEVVKNTVAALVNAFVNVSSVASFQKQAANGAQMLHGGGANEMGVADAELVPQATENCRVAVHQFARGDARFGGGASDIFAVLVGAGQEGDVVPLHAFEPGYCVRDQRGVGGADVRPRVGVIDRRGQIEFGTRISVTQGRSATVRCNCNNLND